MGAHSALAGGLRTLTRGRNVSFTANEEGATNSNCGSELGILCIADVTPPVQRVEMGSSANSHAGFRLVWADSPGLIRGFGTLASMSDRLSCPSTASTLMWWSLSACRNSGGAPESVTRTLIELNGSTVCRLFLPIFVESATTITCSAFLA